MQTENAGNAAPSNGLKSYPAKVVEAAERALANLSRQRDVEGI